MILERPTINFYYDKIIDGTPVPNGVSHFRINKKYFNLPVMSSAEQQKNDQVIRTTYFYNVMKVFNININLFTKDNTSTNMFYPLELTRHGSKILITKIIPEETLNRIKRKEMKILVLYQQWIGDYKLMLSLKERIDTIIRHGVPVEQIYLLTGDVHCSYQELFGKIKVFGIDWWQIAYQLRYKTRYLDEDYHWVSFSPEDLKCLEPNKELIELDNWKEPNFLFTAFTGSPSLQSLAIISELEVKGLLDKGLYEFNIFKNKEINPDSKMLIDKNSSQDYKELKKQSIKNLLPTVKKIDNEKASLENSLFSIISEPFVPKLDKTYLSETNAMWVSPQIWKSIALGHPFIVVGSLSTMRHLNNEGYFSYVDLFNENYDTISNLALKVSAIANEIDRISKLTKDEITEKINLIKPFIKVNQKKFLEKNHTWKFYDLFKEMQYE